MSQDRVVKFNFFECFHFLATVGEVMGLRYDLSFLIAVACLTRPLT